MSSPRYYVSHQNQQMGPYAVDEIVGLVEQTKLSVLDYIYDDEKQDWVLFMDHPMVAEKVRNLKPKAPPKSVTPSPEAPVEIAPKLEAKNKKSIVKQDGPLGQYMEIEWFVLKGDNKFGPFMYTELIKMLQQAVIFEFDFAWHEGLEAWKRIAEIEAFSKENIRTLRDSTLPEVNQIFFRRRHKRVKYGGTILIHDNRKVWKGQAVEISEGGAGIVMENSLVVPGQQLYLHFKPGDGVPPFNAACEVVSKQYVFGVKDTSAPVKYGLKFKDLSNDLQKALKEYSRSGEAA